MTASNRLPSTLSKKILANKFDEAQELIEQGVNLTDGLISKAIWQNKFEAFEFLFNHGQANQISDYSFYSKFMSLETSDSNRFKEFFIKNKDNPALKELFSNSEYQFKSFFKDANDTLRNMNIAYINPEDKKAYNLQLEMSSVINIKKNIDILKKKVENFSTFKNHLGEASIENHLMFEEFQRKSQKYEDIYNNYLVDRLNVQEELKPLTDQKEKINNRIAETLKKMANSNNNSKVKPK